MLALLATAAPVRAQDTPRLLAMGAMAADHATTAWGLSRGYVELNPIHRWAENDPAKVMLSGVALDAAGMYAWTRLTKKQKPTLYKVGLYTMAAWRGYLAVKNIRTLTGHRTPSVFR